MASQTLLAGQDAISLEFGDAGATVTNGAGSTATVTYQDIRPGATSGNSGTLAPGASVTLYGTQWFSIPNQPGNRADLQVAQSNVVGSSSGPITATVYTSGNLTSLTQGGITTTYTYNADGTVATSVTGAVTTTYFWNSDGSLDHTTVA